MDLELRQCGNTDLQLSCLGAGCWAFGGGEYWGEQNQKDVDAVVRRSVDLGINYFDTAEAYNDGRSESSLGRALKGIVRDNVIIGTKVSPSNCYPGSLVMACEGSLQRLGTDYIDLYMIHWPFGRQSLKHFTDNNEILDNPPVIDDAMSALGKLRDEGKIRFIGVSNFDVERFDEAAGCGQQIAANELPYSLLTRAIEKRMVSRCEANGTGVIGYFTLLQGLLADIYPTLSDVPPYQRRTRHFDSAGSELCRHGEQGAEKETSDALAAIRMMMKDSGMTMPEIAVKWALSKKGICCALVGARNNRELESNVKAAAETPLPPEMTAELDTVTAGLLDKLGDSFDYYESLENNRTR